MVGRGAILRSSGASALSATDGPAAHHQTGNLQKGCCANEIKRRTRVASIFPNAASCLRLVSAILAECDEEWMSGKVYLTMDA